MLRHDFNVNTSAQAMTGVPHQPYSFFPTSALDHAAAGLGAGIINTLCMNPLDMLKVKFQVMTTRPAEGSLGRAMWNSLRDIQRTQGWKGLYRGVIPNIAHCASNWGLYFLLYNTMKQNASGGDITKSLSTAQLLIYSAQADIVTTVITNPLGLVRVRMFTSQANSPNSYHGLWHGLSTIVRNEGVHGLLRGTTVSLIGISSGAMQFVTYDKMKEWAFERKRQQYQLSGKEWTPETDKLSNLSYTTMSMSSKLFASSLAYPYQVVRSRIQANIYPSIPATIKHTWAKEGIRGFYRGLGANLVRVLPSTCLTFVVYENLAWALRTSARRREESRVD